MRRPQPPIRRVVIDLAALVLLLGVPVVGFTPSFEGPGYLVAGFGGIALGLAIAWSGLRFRLGALEIIAATVAAYFVFGGVLALPHTAIGGFIPTLDTLTQLALGTVQAWKKLVTTVAPVASSDGHLIVPFLLALVAAVIAGTLALRGRRPAWALVPAVAFLAIEIALGLAQPALPVVQGVVFAVVAIVWLAVRESVDRKDAAVSLGERPDRSVLKALRLRRAITAAVVIALAVGAGAATGALASPPSTRYVLRDVVVPPFDVRAYPSPLQSFRGYVRDDASTTLFTVSGLPKDARVRLATMDAYTGVVYNVADEGAGSSSAFTPMRANMSPQVSGDQASLRFEIGELTGVWVPEAGAAREFTFDGPRADDLRRAAHYNDATGTAVVTAGLAPGDSYTEQAVFAPIPSDEQLDGVAFAPLALPKVDGAPEAIADLAADATGEATTPIQQVRALESWLHTQGFFSNGLEGQVLSPSGHGAARIAALIGGKQMIGDDEQYAVAMALAARSLGIPARVVMGWHADDKDDATDAGGPGGVLTATGTNLHAWVEVAFTGYGWVPFDPTPPKDQVPTDQTTKPKANPRPQVLQPPPPPQEPADVPPTVADARNADDDDASIFAWLGPVLAVTGLSVLVLALIAAPFVAIAIVKGRRRSRRLAAERAADRLSGGWDELVDHALDLRVPVAVGATRTESARALSAAFDPDRVAGIAERADAGVFGPGDPSDADIAAFWGEVDAIVGARHGELSRWRRARARFSVRSLLPERVRARLAALRRAREDRAAERAAALVEHPSRPFDSDLDDTTASAPVAPGAGIPVISGNGAAGLPDERAVLGAVADSRRANPGAPTGARRGRRAGAAVPLLVWDDGAWTAIEGRVLFGRNPRAEEGATAVRVADATLSISKTHFAVEVGERGVDLVDRGSTNGVLVHRGGGVIEAVSGEPLALVPGDVLVLGDRRARIDLIELDDLRAASERRTATETEGGS